MLNALRRFILHFSTVDYNLIDQKRANFPIYTQKPNFNSPRPRNKSKLSDKIMHPRWFTNHLPDYIMTDIIV